MTITAGTRLGPYEILAPLGAGGMGEVWKARDTRLDRSVAIKVLPREFAENAQLKLRFEREAKTISQLEHPHICRLYDVGESTGEVAGARLSYLVMELLEGESLAERLTRGPLLLNEVLRYGAQIAEALDRAHRAGVVHRDLKPGNIMLTKSGAKLLDFGLAKSATLSGAPASSSAYEGATQQKPLTEQGTILGTFQYMAPEQLEGQEADARTDIFALGAVLYEMATGKRAFEGKTKTSLIAAIIRDQPRPMSELQPLTPPAFEHVVSRCLEKDPDDRWQSAHDVASELKWISGAGSQAGIAAPLLAKKKNRERLAWSLAAVATLVAASAIVLWRREARPVERFRFSIPSPGHGPALLTTALNLAISPDGRTVAFCVWTTDAGVPIVHVRSLAEFDSRPIPGTEGGTNPFFSADGRWIGFSAAGKMRKVLATGGSVSDITSAPSVTGADWAEDDRIVYAPSYNTGIYIVSASGGAPKQITTNDPKKRESSHGWPQFLPGGKWIIFTIENSGQSFNDATIAAQSLESGERRVLVRGGTRGQYVPTGHLVFARSSTLFAVPFDARRVKVTGPPVEVMKGVAMTQGRGASHWAFSRTGILVFTPGPEVSYDDVLGFCDRAGTFTPLSEKLNGYNAVALSPDERRIAFQRRWSDDDVWIHDIERDVQTRVTFLAEQSNPLWSPDGRRLVFASDRDGTMNLYTSTPDGTGVVDRLTTSSNSQDPTSISPSGVVAYHEDDPDTKRDVWLLPLTGERKPQPLIRTPYNDYGAHFSPDGKWLLWVSTESGRAEVYVRSMAEGGKWQVSTAGGDEGLWSRDGKEIYYRRGTQMFAVTIATSPALRISRPAVLFEGNYRRSSEGARTYDVTRDGRFLMVKPGPGVMIREHRVVLDWFDELKEKL